MNILENINLDLVGYLVTVNTPITRITLNQDRLVSLTGVQVAEAGKPVPVKKSEIWCPSKTPAECTLDGTVVATKKTCPRPHLGIFD